MLIIRKLSELTILSIKNVMLAYLFCKSLISHFASRSWNNGF